MFDVKSELKKIAASPGVYILKNSNDNIIYIGKAVNLKNRVRQYFQASSQAQSPKVRNLASSVASFEYIVTDNEIEALILENNLIKKHRPKYNVLLKDDKTYPYIKLTTEEPFPRLLLTRSHTKDRGKYFGPFVNGTKRIDILDIIYKVWPIRRCAIKIPSSHNERPCLYYHINQCGAPCIELVSQEEYARVVDEVAEFLSGKSEGILERLQEEMLCYSESMEFERAAEIRDKIEAVKSLDEEQKLQRGEGDDKDVLAFAKKGDTALVQIFFLRGGKMIGRDQLMMTGVEGSEDSKILADFIKQFYGDNSFIPKELLLQADVADRETIAQWLSSMRESQVILTVPKKGEKHKLCELAQKNAALSIEQFGDHLRNEQMRTTSAIEEIRVALGLEASLERIEAFDISNTSGVMSVGSMVVFEGGKPKPSEYRKFRIKYVEGSNDFASMQEVVARRFLRYKEERENGKDKFLKLPDIVFVDGGAPQVAAAQGILEDLGIAIPVAGMVKDNAHKTRALLFDGREVFLKPSSEGFKLVVRIQDEVHRFAVEYHRRLREREMSRSQLDGIRGIGPARRKALLAHFKDIDKIRNADVETLMQVTGITKPAAQSVYDFFREEI